MLTGGGRNGNVTPHIGRRRGNMFADARPWVETGRLGRLSSLEDHPRMSATAFTTLPATLSPGARQSADHRAMANAIRILSIDAIERAKSGHPGMPMGAADIATVLFTRFLKFDPTDPKWPDRDRFILSAGHGSMLLYSALHLLGYPEVTLDEIRNFRQIGSLTPGHPEVGLTGGVETTTGPLGQGLANAVGMALAERMLAARFGSGIVDHHTYVLASDGDLMEGIGQEALSLAGHLRLSKLIVLFDANTTSIDGPTSLTVSDDTVARFRATDWSATEVDGHDPEQIAAALAAAQESSLPTLIACRTVIGYGAPNKAGTEAVHGAPLGPQEAALARTNLGCKDPLFHVPEEVVARGRALGARGAEPRAAWQRRYGSLPESERQEFERRIRGELPAHWRELMAEFKAKLLAEPKAMATRAATQIVVDGLTPTVPELIGGSADLTGSVHTKAKGFKPITADDHAQRYIHYGVRENAMGAMMNGLALHGGFVPYAGSFLVFSDYCRPAIRMSALMGLRVIYVMTHDSIGLGEDGPTHQPVEHLASLRAMPNLQVLRPADGMEVLECWELALARQDGPSMLVLTRQSVPQLRTQPTNENLSARGGYVLAEAEGERRATLLATGSEVSIAYEARRLLAEQGIGAAVVSMPCWNLFDRQPQRYRRQVLGGTGVVRIAVEAASGFGWERYLGDEGLFIGMNGFGASGPNQELYRHFGITAEAIAAAVKSRL